VVYCYYMGLNKRGKARGQWANERLLRKWPLKFKTLFVAQIVEMC